VIIKERLKQLEFFLSRGRKEAVSLAQDARLHRFSDEVIRNDFGTMITHIRNATDHLRRAEVLAALLSDWLDPPDPVPLKKMAHTPKKQLKPRP